MKHNELALKIDHTALKPDTTVHDIQKLCGEAREYNFASVCVLPYYVHTANELLDGANVKICTVVGFPLGATYGLVKSHEAREAIARGATEIDMVANIAALKSEDFQEVLYDIEEVVETSHALGAIVKVIVETCLLTVEEKKKVCELVTQSGADFIKTSTGFSNAGATIEDIQLMRKECGEHVRIKASGGIRTADFTVKLIESGADRIGASASVAIMKEFIAGIERN